MMEFLSIGKSDNSKHRGRFATAVFILFCFIAPSYAYNENGHKVVAQIAYDNLTPQTKKTVTKLVGIVGQYYSFTQFVDGAPWPDWLTTNNVTAYGAWHYINQPFIQEPCLDCQVSPPPPENVIWAILQAEQVLTTPNSRYPKSSRFEKSQFLLFFEHFVGDIHQPLHTITLFSTQFPKGDRGATLYPIRSPIADNLHIFWDEGGGIFPAQNLSDKQIEILAVNIEQAYPQAKLANQVNDLNPVNWAKEGNDIARKVAYTLPPEGVPSQAYIDKVQIISEERVALAGYRLAALLNQIFPPSPTDLSPGFVDNQVVKGGEKHWLMKNIIPARYIH